MLLGVMFGIFIKWMVRILWSSFSHPNTWYAWRSIVSRVKYGMHHEAFCPGWSCTLVTCWTCQYLCYLLDLWNPTPCSAACRPGRNFTYLQNIWEQFMWHVARGTIWDIQYMKMKRRLWPSFPYPNAWDISRSILPRVKLHFGNMLDRPTIMLPTGPIKAHSMPREAFRPGRSCTLVVYYPGRHLGYL